jgi:hypothetical protein
VRCLHACWLTADGGLALYAGQTTGVRALGDLWRLNDGELVHARRASYRRNATCPRTRHGDDAVVFGGLGLDGDYLRDVYRSTARRSPSKSCARMVPAPRARHGAALIDDPGNHRVLLFGGTAGGDAFADTWELTLD